MTRVKGSGIRYNRDFSPDEIKKLESGDLSPIKHLRIADKKEERFDSADKLAELMIQYGLYVLYEKEWEEKGKPGNTWVREFHFNRKPKRPGPRADFAIPSEGLIIECDGAKKKVFYDVYGNMKIGGAHNEDKDAERNNILAILGYRKITFSPKIITSKPDTVIQQITEFRSSCAICTHCLFTTTI